MKKVFLIPLILLVFNAMEAKAQVEFGFIASANATNLDGRFRNQPDKFTIFRSTFGMGVIIIGYLHKHIAIQTEPMFIEKGGRNGLPSTRNKEIILYYIEFPLYLKIKPWKNFYFLTGPYRSVLFSANYIEAFGEADDIDSEIKKQDTGIKFGAGVNISVEESKNRFFIEFILSKGITRISSSPEINNNLVNKALHIKFGIIFGI